MFTLDFEKKIFDKKKELIQHQSEEYPDNRLIEMLTKEIESDEKEIFENLDPWKITQISRHPNRPGAIDFINQEVDDFIELCGDRMFGNDLSIIGGIGKIATTPFMIIGHAKGNTTASNVQHNFGMPHPEGYRKAKRLLELAERFKLPVVSLIDTPGAYPGIEAEERQQSAAIAEIIKYMGILKIPIISVVLGEGGSGGALAISISNKLLMLQYAIFSVISAEGCASILWNDPNKNIQAANILKYTANDLYQLKVIDYIIKEPLTGAHNNPTQTLINVRKAILNSFAKIKKLSPEKLSLQRQAKFRNIGVYSEPLAKNKKKR